MTASSDGIVMDLGCGKNPHPDTDVGVDLHPVEGADIISTLDIADGIQYLPFDDNTASKVHLRHTLEHLSDLDHILSELCRITEPGGEINIRVPYYNSLNAVVDPTHTDLVNHMTEHIFDYSRTMYSLTKRATQASQSSTSTTCGATADYSSDSFRIELSTSSGTKLGTSSKNLSSPSR